MKVKQEKNAGVQRNETRNEVDDFGAQVGYLIIGRAVRLSDYGATNRRVRFRVEVNERCQWCGEKVEQSGLRMIEIRGKAFRVCAKCPPPLTNVTESVGY